MRPEQEEKMRLRVTPRMMNNSRRKAGLSSVSSLLNHVKGNGNGGSSRISALNAQNSKASRVIQSGYEKLESASEKLTKQAELLAKKVDDKEKDLADQVVKLADSYNETLKGLKQAAGVLNQYYHQSLRDVAYEDQKELEEIGITVSSDGTLSVNREKFNAADREKVEKLLGSAGDFQKRVSFVASRINDNAKTSVESVSSRYNSRGDITSSYLSRFNYRR